MQAINRIIAPLKRGLQLLVSRAVVSVVNDAYARQNLQLRLQSDEVADDVTLPKLRALFCAQSR